MQGGSCLHHISASAWSWEVSGPVLRLPPCARGQHCWQLPRRTKTSKGQSQPGQSATANSNAQWDDGKSKLGWRRGAVVIDGTRPRGRGCAIQVVLAARRDREWQRARFELYKRGREQEKREQEAGGRQCGAVQITQQRLITALVGRSKGAVQWQPPAAALRRTPPRHVKESKTWLGRVHQFLRPHFLRGANLS
jgi:hypothetical protein